MNTNKGNLFTTDLMWGSWSVTGIWLLHSLQINAPDSFVSALPSPISACLTSGKLQAFHLFYSQHRAWFCVVCLLELQATSGLLDRSVQKLSRDPGAEEDSSTIKWNKIAEEKAANFQQDSEAHMEKQAKLPHEQNFLGSDRKGFFLPIQKIIMGK